MVARWDPFAELAAMREAVNRMLSDAYTRPTLGWTSAGTSNPFPFDLYESGDDIFVRVAVPGAIADQVELSVNQGVLIIKGQRSFYSGDEEKNFTWHARGLAEGAFQMAIGLPTAVDAAAADATFDNGVLTVKLPKADLVRAKRIAIKHAPAHEALSSGAQEKAPATA